MLNEQKTNLEPFVTSKEVISSGLFPGLNRDKLLYYVAQGYIPAYGPSRAKTFLLSEVYECWKKIKRFETNVTNGINELKQLSKEQYDKMMKQNKLRKNNGNNEVQERSKNLHSGLSKTWKKV